MENSQQPQQQLDLLTPVRRKLPNQLVHAEVKKSAQTPCHRLRRAPSQRKGEK
jgi:hypothetical protein